MFKKERYSSSPNPSTDIHTIRDISIENDRFPNAFFGTDLCEFMRDNVQYCKDRLCKRIPLYSRDARRRVLIKNLTDLPSFPFGPCCWRTTSRNWHRSNGTGLTSVCSSRKRSSDGRRKPCSRPFWWSRLIPPRLLDMNYCSRESRWNNLDIASFLKRFNEFITLKPIHCFDIKPTTVHADMWNRAILKRIVLEHRTHLYRSWTWSFRISTWKSYSFWMRFNRT